MNDEQYNLMLNTLTELEKTVDEKPDTKTIDIFTRLNTLAQKLQNRLEQDSRAGLNVTVQLDRVEKIISKTDDFLRVYG